MTPLTYDPRLPEVRADPYPMYRALRDEDPVRYVPSAGLWFLSRHADCLSVLRDSRFSARHGQRLRTRHIPLPDSMLTTDPPEHTRLRRAVTPIFDAAAMRRARPWIAATVDARLRNLHSTTGSGSEVDAAADFARPLATAVLARFLGVPDEDQERFAGWGQAVAVNLDPFADPDSRSPASRAMDEMLDWLADQLQSRRAVPRDDALTVLAHAYDNGVLVAAEALATANLLVVGGLEPLADMVSNALAALIDSPVRLAPAGPRPRTVVEELLRIDAPIQFVARTARDDVAIDGRVVRRGESVVALLGAANHDAARFTEPERLTLDRRTNPHLSFGSGVHACLGAPLARLFGELVLTHLWSTLPSLCRGVAPAVRRSTVVPRGYLHLPVRCARDQP